jgi:hypothetical protein
MFIALNGFGRLQTGKTRQTRLGTDTANSRYRTANVLSNILHDVPAASKLQNHHCFGLADALGTASRSGTAVMQSAFALHQKTTHPLTGSRLAYILGSCRSIEAKPPLQNLLNQFHSTRKRQSGILMYVHSAELPEGLVGWRLQFLKLSPNEHEQPIATSQLGWG